MTNAEFRTWLAGYFELAEEGTPLGPRQIQIIVNHLNLAEAVEGKLDAQNENIRGQIRAFLQSDAPDDTAVEALTLELQSIVK